MLKVSALDPSSKATVALETITPDLASRYLKLNRNNRHLREGQVDRLIRDHLGDQFLFNGDTIVFGPSEDGGGEELFDGQHRLTMCVESSKPFIAIVVRGVERAAKQTIDKTIRRSLGDELQMAGYPNSLQLGGILAYVHRAAIGRLSDRHPHTIQPTATEAFRLLRAYPEAVDAARKAAGNDVGEILAPSVYGFLWLGTHLQDPARAEGFCVPLISGENLQSGHPVYTLRRKLRSVRSESKHRTHASELAYALIAWSKFKARRDLSTFPRDPFDPFPSVFDGLFAS